GVGCNAPWGVPFDDKICEGLNCKSGGITVSALMPVSGDFNGSVGIDVGSDCDDNDGFG
ncbi:unnamed protein product, partial [Anisakis simplex]|uniref:Peptidase S1 domain-containing protein n=1 Tax=Anisakis simplex TaxID=6269 RepID=A0A0M3JI73_ANISI